MKLASKRQGITAQVLIWVSNKMTMYLNNKVSLLRTKKNSNNLNLKTSLIYMKGNEINSMRKKICITGIINYISQTKALLNYASLSI